MKNGAIYNRNDAIKSMTDANWTMRFGVFLQVPSSQKKQKNQTIEFSWELYCLVALFLLFYVICDSVPTEGTEIWSKKVSVIRE